MIWKLCVGAVLAGALSIPASAQLVGERISGAQRICVYAGSLSGAAGARAHSVSFGEGCPSTPPPARTNFAAPPTAQLSTDIPGPDVRRCIYEQAGQQWVFSIPARRSCPLAAGMLYAGPDRISPR